MMRQFGLFLVVAVFVSACGDSTPTEVEHPLIINEIVSSNDGVNIDEEGQTEDWLELANTSGVAISLKGYFIADGSGEKIELPDLTIAPHSELLFWADDDPDGELHLPFKLSSSGELLQLFDAAGLVVDSVDIPALGTNQAFARFPSLTGPFSRCRYATPGRSNGQVCEPPVVSTIEDKVEFLAFDQVNWPRMGPDSLGINELALFPSRFVEIKNFGQSTVALSGHGITISAKYPNSLSAANYLPFPDVSLAPGEVLSVDVPEAFTAELGGQESNEAVLALWGEQDEVLDFVPFMHWPQGAALARAEESPFRFHFCENTSKDEVNQCSELSSRYVGDRVRGFYTPGDFAALASGGSKANIQSVKFVIDLEDNNAVYLLGAERWPLHYTFVREVIEMEPKLDRCEASENRTFNQGWYDFSVENYFSSTTRRYHLGTLSKHVNANLSNVEFTFGDEIVSSQMKDAFYIVTPFTYSPFSWTLRPQDLSQVSKVREVEGELPIVSPKAPFKNIVFQGLAPGLAYGILTYVATHDLANASLGNQVIVITNDVPNDIDFVGGLITEAFQTPLAHVNILSQSRNTPNMALPGASEKPEFTALIGKLVRLEVTSAGYTLKEAAPAEAKAFWDEQIEQIPVLTPRLDIATAGLVDLLDASFGSLPSIGAKAAQMSEMFKIKPSDSICSEGGDFAYPVGAFAVPVSHYLRHFESSGAEAYLSQLMINDSFATDAVYRKASLVQLRQMMMEHPVNAELMTLVESWVEDRFGDARVRFRSSSNTEDLADFNGAGLYDSLSAELNSSKRPIDTALKTVWASLWNSRAFDERLHANVDQSAVAMGILVHSAFTDERANGVGVGRNLLDPSRADQFYFNSQAGEASVTNPAPGVVTEQLVYQWPTRTPTLTYQSNSSIVDGPVITPDEVRALACALDSVQEHFRSILDPLNESRWFTMETEFKFLGESRELLLKQARPFKFGRLDIPNDCREF